MDEILKSLMESELLSEEVKAEIKEKVGAQLATLRENIEAEVRAQLAEQWTKDRDLLVESVDEKVTKFLESELQELREDIERFRDLEAEFADKLIAEKKKLAEQVGEELDQITDKLDAFLEERFRAEFDEIKQDLKEAQTVDFGRKIFEAFKGEFARSFKEDETSIHAKADVLESKLADAESKLAEIEAERNKLVRESALEKVLAPLTGAKREQMEIILAGTSTERLQETYNKFIGKILKETTEQTTEKTVTESTEQAQTTTVVTGNVEEETSKTTVNEEAAKVRERILRLAGVKQ